MLLACYLSVIGVLYEYYGSKRLVKEHYRHSRLLTPSFFTMHVADIPFKTMNFI